MHKIILILALMLSLHKPALAVTQDPQTLVDNVQSLAFHYATTKNLQNPNVQSSIQALLSVKAQGSELSPYVENISKLAYQTPVYELLNTADIKRLLNAPNIALGKALQNLKDTVVKYQKGQPVKTTVLGSTVKGNELVVQVRLFPDVLQRVKEYDPNQVGSMEQKTLVTYMFDMKTGHLTQMFSDAYNQALDLRQQQVAQAR